jgi:peptide subunit release factor RF-3
LPFYEGLTVEDLLAYAKQREDVMRALPAVQHEILKLPREYLGNVIITIVGDPFQEWVDAQISARNAKYKEEHDQNLEVDSEVEAAYLKSTSIGSKFVASHFFI